VGTDNRTMAAYFQQVGYDPHKEQWSFHNSKARFRVATCGRRFGKSTMAARDVVPKQLLQKDRMVWLVGPTYLLAEKEFRVIWNDLIIKKKFGKDKRVKKSYNVRTGDMHIYFPWGTRIEARSAEHPDLLVGEGLDHVIMCEAAKHKKETWDRFIRPSLADRRGSADFPTTPEGFNFLYDLWRHGRDPNIPEYESWRFPSWSNTHVYPGGRQDPEILLLEKTMDAEWFNQEIGADFASFVGKIFPDWDEFVHVRPHTYNPAWKNYITFDWGYTNPLAAVEFQVSPDDRIFVWRVYYKSYKTVPDVAAELAEQEQPEGYKVDLCFGDPADPEAVQVMSTELNKRFREKGIPSVQVWAPKNLKTDYTWLDGIMLMRQFMKADREVGRDEWGTPTLEPAYFVDPSCLPVIKEHSNYRSKEAIKGRNVPEMGNKIEDHTIDAIRYALVCIFKIGCQNRLADVMGTSSPSELIVVSAPNAFQKESALVTAGAPDVFDGSYFGTGAGGFFTGDLEF
jgi:hypothetical protein